MGSAKLKELNRISIGTVGLTVVTAVLLFVPLPLFCRIVVVVMFLGWLGFRLGRFLVGSREGVITRLVFGLMIVLSWLVVSQSIVYYLDRISRFSLLVGLLPLVFFAIHRFNLTETTNQTIIKPKSSIWSRWLSIGILVGDVVLFFSFLSVRTDEALRSPWEVVSCSALLAFVSVTWMLLLLCREPDAPFKRSLTALHLFVAYCLSETVMSLGFGYDPFIHRTAEAHIAEFGNLLPKSPYYIGHYVLIVALHWLSGLSVDVIDRWLVPFLAPLTFPWVASFGLKKVWGMKGSVELWMPLILFLPMLPLTFTVPHALTVVFLLWLVFLAPTVISSSPLRSLVIGLSVSAMMIHPLLGAVAVGLIASLFLCHRFRFGGLLSVIINAILLPILFFIHNWLKGDLPFNFVGLLSDWERFIALFRNPFFSDLETSFSLLDLLYMYRMIMPAIFVAIVVIGVIFLVHRKMKSSVIQAYILTAVGLLLAIFVLSTSVTLSGIVPGEQLEFSLRLKHAFGVLLLPLFFFGLKSLLDRYLRDSLTATVAGLLLVVAIVASISWYLTYPQANHIANRSGWCLGRADVETIEIIAKEDNGRPYLVLSNQMLSVAALRTNGFDNFFYALPVTGRTYEYYLAISHSRRNRGVFEEAFTEFGVARVFYVVHDYESDFHSIVDQLESISDQSWVVADGRAFVFLFEDMAYN
ncbi:hypothetical protein A2480_03115 [Candidatus Uhrbacteria bacterium RIFOXYC2_FULL_47_19]|uniref:Uncharacterized protein n=1 Tax=Candidatus Uhrbacteria bacterium RIFOXYC2_FULL_47_19 TaxID=1802424 RepID=A0A1F7WF18_9BACT|nr:MAG: hypothetical protein A2480_03115 [Candidatus Uhrbacteria bacterium RIFOXYC2_FULL_47_19]HCC21817.1 hypothetical protein [Candidatus Uhrbacteria bacterium]